LGRRRERIESCVSPAKIRFARCQTAYRPGFELAVTIDVAAQYHKKLIRPESTIRFLAGNTSRDMHREPPLDNHAREKSEKG
jgi:hypothetical protein